MAEVVMSSGRVKPTLVAITEKISMVIATVMPVGTEKPRIFLMNLFLTRSVLDSKARITPGRPIQAKLRSDISRGA